jgi:hypothetical protein
MEFVARVLVQIPDTRRHLVRYYGAHSNRARGQRRKAEAQIQANGPVEAEEPVPASPERAALRRRWAKPIRREHLALDTVGLPGLGASYEGVELGVARGTYSFPAGPASSRASSSSKPGASVAPAGKLPLASSSCAAS